MALELTPDKDLQASMSDFRFAEGNQEYQFNKLVEEIKELKDTVNRLVEYVNQKLAQIP